MIRCPICNSLKSEDEPCPGCLVKYGLETPDGDGGAAREASFRSRLSALWTPAVVFAPVTLGLSVCTFVLGLAVSQTFANDPVDGIRDGTRDSTRDVQVDRSRPPAPVEPAPPANPSTVPTVPTPPVVEESLLAAAEVEAAARREAEAAARRAAEEAARAAHEARRFREEAARSRAEAARGREEALRMREEAERQAVEARRAAEERAHEQAVEARRRAEHAEVAYHQLLERDEAGDHEGVLARSGEVLELRSVWSGATYTERVDRAYTLRARAAMALWKAGGSAGLAQQTALEWAQFAQAAGRSTTEAVRLCREAGGDEVRCSP